MIWYREAVTVPDAPVGSTVNLVGIYNPPEDQGTSPLIELKAEVVSGPDATALILTLFTHNPSGLGHQETPTAEDIRTRYNPKVIKAKNRLETTNFHQLATIRRIP
jgi:hypothetical protein